MGLHRVLSMLLLIISIYCKGQMNTTGRSSSCCLYHQDTWPHTQVRAVTPHSPLLLRPCDRQPIAQFSPLGDKRNTRRYLMREPTAEAASEAVDAEPRRMGMQQKVLKVLEGEKTRKMSMFSRDTDSLQQMLAALVQQELRGCNLVLAYDAGEGSQQALLEGLLLHLPNPRQVVEIKKADDLLGIVWESSECRGYLFLLDTPEPLLTYANTYHHSWDYGGRFVLVGPSLEHLEAFTETKNGKKTEQILGAVKSSSEGEWLLYMNQLYWGQGVRRVNSWHRYRFTRPLDLFPDKVSDLQGAVLKVSTFMFEPCVFYHRAPNGSVLFRYGVDIEVSKTVARLLNFTAKFEEPTDRKTWGSKLENGSWYGMMGQLERDEVDFGVANLYVSGFRSEILDFTAPYSSEMTCFLARMEPPLARWQALAFPFRMWTWLAILAGLIVSGPLLFSVAWCSGRGMALIGACLLVPCCGGGEIGSLGSLSLCWYYAFGMHVCEAHASLPRKTSTQIFVLFLWLYTMILTIAYTTNLRAFLIVRKPPAMMETIKELYESGLQVAAEGTVYRDGIASSSDPNLQGLTRVYKAYDYLEDTFPLVQEGKAVFLGNRVTLEFLVKNRFTSRGVPRMRIMKENFASYSISMALQRHSPLRRKVDRVLGWIRQSGLVPHYFFDSLRQAAAYERAGDGEEESGGSQEESGGSQEEAVAEVVVADGVIPLGLDHMQGVFLITGIGWILSAQVFLLENTMFSDKM